ncbi:MAG: glycine cleavage system aminomethyltransferase GcvT [Alphaproteobacteria bacterium]|nr:glycine cleavage system aminomethyltransferase GcvT [Alphaproteobacteria bacterium]
MTAADLRQTALHALHVAAGARMVPFAGYDMPVQYKPGILQEHLHTREAAGLFDVSHMGQAALIGPDHATTAAALERLVPGEIQGLGLGRMRYTLLLNEKGGIEDDLMVTRGREPADDGVLLLVVNAARKEHDFAYLRERLPANVRLVTFEDRALIALQGPKAAAVLARHAPVVADLGFMTATSALCAGLACHISRSGYTGEDGFEISVPGEHAVTLAECLLAEEEVMPIGLGARDSLRLEAGLCLYGHDIDETTSPVEAGLTFAIGKRRKIEKDFLGAPRIMAELFDGAQRQRVGMRLEGRAPAREGAAICDDTGTALGTVTSGGFAPSLNAAIAMGYVAPRAAKDGTPLQLIVRDQPRPASTAPMPFVPHRYFRRKEEAS